jgi:hypothetical protein
MTRPEFRSSRESADDPAMRRLHRDQVALRHDVTAVRQDLADGFATMHTRFAVIHREMTRMLEILAQLERKAAARESAA